MEHSWERKEESFEHTHKVSQKHVRKFSGNQCDGQKIVENMRQSWVSSSLLLQKIQGEAEQNRIQEGNRIKRPRFS